MGRLSGMTLTWALLCCVCLIIPHTYAGRVVVREATHTAGQSNQQAGLNAALALAALSGAKVTEVVSAEDASVMKHPAVQAALNAKTPDAVDKLIQGILEGKGKGGVVTEEFEQQGVHATIITNVNELKLTTLADHKPALPPAAAVSVPVPTPQPVLQGAPASSVVSRPAPPSAPAAIVNTNSVEHMRFREQTTSAPKPALSFIASKSYTRKGWRSVSGDVVMSPAEITTNSHAITPSGQPRCVFTSAKFGELSQVRTVAYDLSPSAHGALSIEAFFLLHSTANNRGWLFGQKALGGFGRALMLHDERFGGGAHMALGVGHSYKSSIPAPATGRWTHVVAVWNQPKSGGKGTATLYVNWDGSPQSHGRKQTVDTKNKDGEHSFSVGGLRKVEEHEVDAEIAYINIYDSALSEQQVISRYLSRSPCLQKSQSTKKHAEL